MTSNELHDIIKANSEAKAFADAGNDTGALGSILKDLPKQVRKGSFYTELGVFTAFPTAEDAEACLQKLEAIAEQNPVVKRVLKWLGPGNGGVDFGDEKLRAAIDGMLGVLSQEEINALKSLGEGPTTVTVDEVSEAWARYRGDK